MPLSLDTELPTPFGWTTVRSLNSSSVLFDELGYPCRVTNLSPPYVTRGYEVWAGWGKRREPEDEGRLLVGAEQRFTAIRHKRMETMCENKTLEGISAPPSNWPVWKISDHLSAKPIAQEVTADEVSGAVRKVRKHGSLRTDTYLNWHIPITFSLQLPARKLPVDPYVLGLCINYYKDGKLKVSKRHFDWYRQSFAEAGYTLVNVRDVSPKAGRNTIFHCEIDRELVWKFDRMGFRNRIPRDYLRAPELERRALLAGLMDMWKEPVIHGPDELMSYYATRDSRLAREAAELVRSLGYPAILDELDISNLVKPHVWSAEWHPVEVPQRSPRLAVRHMHSTVRTGNDLERFVWKIYSCDDWGTMPVRDISVESNNNMFAAGKLFLPVKGDYDG